MPLTKQKGVALIVVLMIIAMLVAISAAMTGRLSNQFYRNSQSQGHLQAYWYASGAEALALVAVEQSMADNDKVTSLNQPWSIKDAVYPLGTGTVTGNMIDKQACFNINVFNSLPASEPSQRHFLQNALIYILQETELKEDENIETYLAEQIADSIFEFVDDNDEINTPAGVESSSYQAFSPAYDAPNGLLVDESELRSVNQVSAEIMKELEGILCAIPTSKLALNVNTIEPEQAIVLSSFFQSSLSLEDAREIIDNRPRDGWQTINDFMNSSELNGVSNEIRNQAQPYLDVRSQYFELEASLNADESSAQLTSLIYSGDYKTAKVIRRSLGGIQ